MYKPSALEIMQAMVVVFCDPPSAVPPDAIFIHGTSVRDDKNRLVRALTVEAAKLYNQAKVLGGVPTPVVVNGLTVQECEEEGMSYRGYEYQSDILQDCGVKGEDIISIPRSDHTGIEAKNLVVMANEKGWKTIVIMSQPFHQLRCFLQMVAVLNDAGIADRIKVYNLTHSSVPWGLKTTKRMHGVAEDVEGTISDQVVAEFGRICEYATPDGKYMRHATIQEMLEYVAKRDSA